MRDPILHLDFPSDFDELCAVADQTQSVDIDDLGPGLARVTAGQQRVYRGQPVDLHFFLGDFNDIS